MNKLAWTIDGGKWIHRNGKAFDLVSRENYMSDLYNMDMWNVNEYTLKPSSMTEMLTLQIMNSFKRETLDESISTKTQSSNSILINKIVMTRMLMTLLPKCVMYLPYQKYQSNSGDRIGIYYTFRNGRISINYLTLKG